MTTSDPVAVDLGGVTLACLTSASIEDTGRPLAVCVHGFPDSASTWRHLLPALDDAGYRAVAPYLRGYAPSSVPDDGIVQTGASVVDVTSLHRHFEGDSRAVLVGHDWGASIVYGAANFEPDRWDRVVAMAVPPGGAMAAAFVSNTDQLKRSWYMFFFQLGLADFVVADEDLAFIDMIWRDWSPGRDLTEDVTRAKDAIRDPANLAAALGYYRATFGNGPTDPALSAAQDATRDAPGQPTLYLHGADDGCIGTEVAESARAMVGDHVTIQILDGLGHFLQLEDPATVNQTVLEFLS